MMRVLSNMASSRPSLAHPIPIAAALLLALNDHVLKGAHVLPGIVTGKLSDVCGLFVLPIVIAAITNRRVLACAIVLVGFSLVKIEPHANAMWCALFGKTLIDPTDLFALPAIFASFVWMKKERTISSPWMQRAGVILSGVACLATSAPAHPPRPPDAPAPIARTGPSCAIIRVDGASAEGNQTTIHLSLENKTNDACDVTIDRAFVMGRAGNVETSATGRTGVIRVNPQSSTVATIAFALPYPIGCQGIRTGFEAVEKTDPPSPDGVYVSTQPETTVGCVKTQPMVVP